MATDDKDKEVIRFVAVYARVSTARQEEDGTIETQLSAVRKYAKENGLTIVREYIDEGWSGDSLDRPALDDLRFAAKAKAKPWDAVLTYDPDRIARRYSFQELIMDEIVAKGIPIVFVTIPAPTNPEEKILYGVRGLFAEYERAKISERFRLGKRRKIDEGKLLVSRPLYGFDHTPRNGNESGFYTINEEQAQVVKMIFSWVADEGLTLRKVVLRLQELSIKPVRSTRGVWSTSTLTTMLRNEAYIGKAHWYSSIAIEPINPIKQGHRKIKKSSRKARPKDEWVYVPVPRIINDELFERTQICIAEHARLNKRSKKYNYLLSGRMECVCGKNRCGAARQKGKYLYYDCTDKVYCFPLPRECKENPINATKADGLVWEKIEEMMSSEDLLNAQVELWLNTKNTKTVLSVDDVDALTDQIEKLKHKQKRYEEAYAAEAMSVETLKEYTDQNKVKVAELYTRIGLIEQNNQNTKDVLPTKDEIKIFVAEARKTLKDLSFEQKRDIVLGTVERIVGSQQQLVVHGNISVYSSLNYGGFTTKDRHCRVAERGKVHAF
jgi:site-specific DNA recombinase